VRGLTLAAIEGSRSRSMPVLVSPDDRICPCSMVVAAVQPADLARIDHHGRASDRFVDRLDNRRAIDERLHEKTARERRYGQPALGSDDRPDDFKAINDRYGHSAGRRHASRVPAPLHARFVRSTSLADMAVKNSW